jgi:hypothetical protein
MILSLVDYKTNTQGIPVITATITDRILNYAHHIPAFPPHFLDGSYFYVIN